MKSVTMDTNLVFVLEQEIGVWYLNNKKANIEEITQCLKMPPKKSWSILPLN